MAVLVVDPSPTMRRIAMRALRAQTSEPIVEARTGSEARDASAASDLSLVILDRDLPDTDALDLARSLREKRSAIKILFLSTRNGKDEVQETVDAGADAILLKPFAVQALESRVRGFLEVGVAEQQSSLHDREDSASSVAPEGEQAAEAAGAPASEQDSAEAQSEAPASPDPGDQEIPRAA